MLRLSPNHGTLRLPNDDDDDDVCFTTFVNNSSVLPAMTYGAETWTLTKLAQNKLAAAQTKMERRMLNITYKDRRTNIWVRERTKLIDIIYTVRK